MPTARPPTDIDAARTFALAGELRSTISRLHRRLREESHLGDFTWSEIKVLTRLEREGSATLTTLAQAEGVRTQSLGATLAALREAGLVEGQPDPADRRQTMLSLTEACRDRIRASRAARQDWLFRALQAQLEPTGLDELATCIAALNRLADF